MNGVELSTTELAYLLATLDCQSVVGLDDPALFPTSPSVMGKTFKNGREALEENGWIKPIKGNSEEYELDALLLEAVSVIAAPEYMAAGTFSTDSGTSELLLHYLAAETAVELSALEKKLYWVSMLENWDDVIERITLLMQLEKPGETVSAEVDQTVLDKVKTLVNKGKQADAMTTLESSNLTSDQISSLLAAIESKSRGSQVVARVEDGEIISGRRFYVYGSGSAAWMSYLSESDSTEMVIRSCSASSVGEFINNFIGH
jgi:hypothetical protein